MKSNLHKPTFAAFAVTLAFLSATSPAFAQKDWIGPNPDNNWFTPTNWTGAPPSAPTLTDDSTIHNGTAATVAATGAETQQLFLGNIGTGTLNITGTGELTAAGFVHIGLGNNGTLNITGGGTLRHPAFDARVGESSGVDGFATVSGTGSNWLLHVLTVGAFGHGTLNILNGGLVTAFDVFIAESANSTGLAVIDGAGGASTLQLGGNLFVGGNGIATGGTGVLRVLNGGIVNSNRLFVWSTGTLEIGVNPMITVTNPSGIEFDGGKLKTIANTTFTNNALLLAGGIILDSNGFTSTLSGMYSGTGGATKIGAGTMILSGSSNYTGATAINAGVLQVDGLLFSGTNVNSGGTLSGKGTIAASVFNNGGVVSPGSPGTSPGTLMVIGSYGQTAPATLRIDIGGLNAGQHDLLSIGSNASLAGTLQLVQFNNFLPMNGDQVTILTAVAGRSGQFSVTDNFPGLIRPHAEYDPNDVRVVFALTNSFASQALTPNQGAVANNVDDATNDPAAAALIAFLGNQPLGNLPHDYDLIAPEELAAIYEVGFSQSMVQNNNLERRMDDIRAGSNGFCANNFVARTSGKEDVSKGADGKVVLPSKDGPEVYIPTENNRWGVFINGSGDFVKVDDHDLNAPGYDIATGDFTLGADYRVSEHFAIGIDGGYSSSRAELVNDGRVEVDGGKIGAYATVFGKGFFGSKAYLDVAVGGGLNNYDTLRIGLQDELVRGTTDGTEFNALIAYGSDWTFGCFNIGTWSTLQYTNVNIDEFTEAGSLAPLEIQDQGEDSIRATTGIHASYDIKAGHAILRPEVRAAWQTEYGDRAYQVDSRLASGAGGVFRVRGPRIGRDAALLGAGLTMQWSRCLATYVFYDGVFGRSNYDNNAVSGGLRVSF